MSKYEVRLTKQAAKDLNRLKAAGLSAKAKQLYEVLEENPFQNPPPYEKLLGTMDGFYSRRINIQHRLVYAVEPGNKVRILRMWTHYEY